MKLGILLSHPVQYYAPLFRELTLRCELRVFFAHRQTAEQQGQAGFGQAFDWDVSVLDGYAHSFLPNRAAQPDVSRFGGCDTPAIAGHIRTGGFTAFIVMGWYLRCYWQAVLACRRAGVPVLVRGDSQLNTASGGWKAAVRTLTYPLLLRSFDGFLYVGQRNRDYLRHYQVPESRLFHSPHCVDVARFSAQSISADIATERQRLGVPEGHALAIFVGKFIAKKQVGDLIEAARCLHSEGVKIHLALIGAGPLEQSLRQQVSSREAFVTFAGFRNQSELPVLYAAADVLLLPSDAGETWGLVVNEAQACGTPVVVADTVGCSPDLAQGLNGETYPCGDIPALAAAMKRVLVRGKSGLVRQSLLESAQAHSPAAAAEGCVRAAIQLAQGRRA